MRRKNVKSCLNYILWFFFPRTKKKPGFWTLKVRKGRSRPGFGLGFLVLESTFDFWRSVLGFESWLWSFGRSKNLKNLVLKLLGQVKNAKLCLIFLYLETIRILGFRFFWTLCREISLISSFYLKKLFLFLFSTQIKKIIFFRAGENLFCFLYLSLTTKDKIL